MAARRGAARVSGQVPGVVRFAFYGRMSTSESQDPRTSRAWQCAVADELVVVGVAGQRGQAGVLVELGGGVVAVLDWGDGPVESAGPSWRGLADTHGRPAVDSLCCDRRCRLPRLHPRAAPLSCD
ncbi:hypothetical protein ACFPN7_06590 [Amycolatopsis halotolerans]|uniref:hypothetical protein n=1 Tax=Amycolatopsis halotolerans TaxID=330083 RepID=UPI003618B2E9